MDIILCVCDLEAFQRLPLSRNFLSLAASLSPISKQNVMLPSRQNNDSHAKSSHENTEKNTRARLRRRAFDMVGANQLSRSEEKFNRRFVIFIRCYLLAVILEAAQIMALELHLLDYGLQYFTR